VTQRSASRITEVAVRELVVERVSEPSALGYEAYPMHPAATAAIDNTPHATPARANLAPIRAITDPP